MHINTPRNIILIALFFILFSTNLSFSQKSNFSKEDVAIEAKLTKLIAHFSENENKLQVAKLQNQLAFLYWQHGYTTDAEKYYNSALSNYTLLNDNKKRAEVFKNLSTLKVYQKKYDEALNNLNEAINYQKTSNNKSQLLISLKEKGTILSKKKQYSQAITPIIDALQIAEEKNQKKDILECYSMLAEFYKKAGDDVNSLIYYKKFLGLKDEFKENVDIVENTDNTAENTNSSNQNTGDLTDNQNENHENSNGSSNSYNNSKEDTSGNLADNNSNNENDLSTNNSDLENTNFDNNQNTNSDSNLNMSNDSSENDLSNDFSNKNATLGNAYIDTVTNTNNDYNKNEDVKKTTNNRNSSSVFYKILAGFFILIFIIIVIYLLFKMTTGKKESKVVISKRDKKSKNKVITNKKNTKKIVSSNIKKTKTPLNVQEKNDSKQNITKEIKVKSFTNLMKLLPYVYVLDKQKTNCLAVNKSKDKVLLSIVDSQNLTCEKDINLIVNNEILKTKLSASEMLKDVSNKLKELGLKDKLLNIGVCQIDTKTKNITYSGANIPMIIQDGDNFKIYASNPTSLPPSINMKFSQKVIKFEKNMQIYLLNKSTFDKVIEDGELKLSFKRTLKKLKGINAKEHSKKLKENLPKIFNNENDFILSFKL